MEKEYKYHPSVYSRLIKKRAPFTTACGKTVLLDPDDKERLQSKKFHYNKTHRHIAFNNLGKTTILHRHLLDAYRGEKVIHIDGNPLNCTRANLLKLANKVDVTFA